MTHTLWIVLGISLLVVFGFIAVMRTQVRENREIESKIDYSKVKPLGDEDEEEEKALREKWGK
jgi:low affinity Fe/Cu permease